MRPSTEKDPTKAAPLSAWCAHLQRRTQSGGPLYVPDVPNNIQGPQTREPSKCLNGPSYGERLARETWKKTLPGPWLLLRRQSIFPHSWCCWGLHKPSSCTTFMHNSLWGRAAAGKKKSLAPMCAGSLQSCPTLRPCRLWPARLLCQGGGFSRQEPANLKKRETVVLTWGMLEIIQSRRNSVLWHL